MLRKKLLFIALVITLIFTQSFSLGYTLQTYKTEYTDVSSSDPSAVFINYLSSQGIINGFTDGTYKPRGYLTRAQAAAVIVRALGISTERSDDLLFKDVDQDHWACDVIGTAVKAKLLLGYPDGTFRPNDYITKAQSIVLISRLSGEGLPEIATTLPKDVSTNHWAAKEIGFAILTGMVETSDSFNPDSNFTRGEMARALSISMIISPTTRSISLNGELLGTKGSVMVKRKDEEEFKSITLGRKVLVGKGDTIKTELNSIAEITFEDGSGLLLDSNTEIKVVESIGQLYIGKQGNPGNAIDLLKVDLEKGKLRVFLSSVISKKDMSNSNVKKWWEEPFYDKTRVQINMKQGTVNMKNGVGFFEILSQNKDVVYNLLGELDIKIENEIIKIMQTQKSTFTKGTRTLVENMKEVELVELISEAVKTFLTKGSSRAVENDSINIYNPGSKSMSVLQKETLLEMFKRVESNMTKNTIQIIGGGGGGGGSTSPTNPPNPTGPTDPREKSSNANLSDLVVSMGTLGFNIGTLEYTIIVNHTVECITVTPTAQDPKSLIRVNNINVNSGLQSEEINLIEGINTIIIEVIAEDGTSKEYKIFVTKSPVPTPPSIDLNGSWVYVGEAGLNEGPTESIDFYISEGTPYIAYTSNFTSSVKKLIGGSWINIGDLDFAGDRNPSYISLTVDKGTPYIAYRKAIHGGENIVVEKFTGSQWSIVGSQYFTGNRSYQPHLRIFEGELYVAYSSQDYKVSVEKFEGSEWTVIGERGFSDNMAYSPVLYVYNQIPYIAYQDGWNGKLTVMMYNGETWEVLGNPRFSRGGTVYSIALKVFDGIPYIAYQDGQWGPVVVQKFNNGNWEDITTLNATNNNRGDVTINLNSHNSIFVAYEDDTRDYKATVMHYNGSRWDLLGEAGFTPHRGQHLKVKVDGNTPYISFVESDYGTNPIEGRVTVMKFTDVENHEIATTTPIINNSILRSGECEIEGKSEANAEVIMTRGGDSWSTYADREGDFIISLGGDDRIYGFDEITITAQVTGKSISEPLSIVVQYAGSGTEDDPYEIWNLGELNGIRYNLSAHYKFCNDEVDASETKTWNEGNGWEPIGTWSDPFTGTIAGDYGFVYGLYVDRGENNVGLFGVTNGAIIKKLGVYLDTVKGDDHVGGLVGYNEDTVIEKCYVATVGEQGTVIGSNHVGGMIGTNKGNSIIKECFSEVDVLGNYSSDSLGGLIGKNTVTAGIFNSYATGNITGGYDVGGLVGQNVATDIINSYATGEVRGVGAVGGLIGVNQQSNVYSSFALNNLIERRPGYELETFGKVVGIDWGNTSYNNIFALRQMVYVPGDGVNGEDIEFIEARDLSTYMNQGWDFAGIWKIDSYNPSYPHLREIRSVVQNAGTGGY